MQLSTQTQMRESGCDGISSLRLFLQSADNFDELAGTTVIIAMTAEGLGGVVATPTGEQYDYVISAQTLQTILDGETIKRYDELLELLAGLLLGIAIILITRFLPYWVIGICID